MNLFLLLTPALLAFGSAAHTTKPMKSCASKENLPYYDDVYRKCLGAALLGGKATFVDTTLYPKYIDFNGRNLLHQCVPSENAPTISSAKMAQFEECYASAAGQNLGLAEKAVAAIAFEKECGIVSELLAEHDCVKAKGEHHRIYGIPELQELQVSYDLCQPKHSKLLWEKFKCPDEGDIKSFVLGIFTSKPKIDPAELQPFHECFVNDAIKKTSFTDKTTREFERAYDVSNLIYTIKCKLSRVAIPGIAEVNAVNRLGVFYRTFKTKMDQYAAWFANSFSKRLQCMFSLIPPKRRLKELFCTQLSETFANCIPLADHLLIAGSYLDVVGGMIVHKRGNDRGWSEKDEKSETRPFAKQKGKFSRMLHTNPMTKLFLTNFKKATTWIRSKVGVIFCHEKYGLWGKTTVGDLIRAFGGDPTKLPPELYEIPKRPKRGFADLYFLGLCLSNAGCLIFLAVCAVITCIVFLLNAYVPAYAALLSGPHGWLAIVYVIAAVVGTVIVGMLIRHFWH